MKPDQWNEMYTDFESMIDKLKYYTEIAKGYTEGEEMPEEEEYPEDDGEEISINKDPKSAAILAALKGKMKK